MFHPHGPTFWELARQALSSTEHGYDLLAPKFDWTPFRTPSLVLNQVGYLLSDSQPVTSLLDLCCGTGAGLEALSPLVTKRLTGIDFSRGMLEVAEENLKRTLQGRSNPPQREWVHGDVLDMRFDDEFDLAVTFGALGHILPHDELRFLQRIWDALRDGGKFVFVTTPLPSRWSWEFWLSFGFNSAMRIRNWLVKPAFIMYYLTFTWPEIAFKLNQVGFKVKTQPLFPNHPEWSCVLLVTASKSNTPNGSSIS